MPCHKAVRELTMKCLATSEEIDEFAFFLGDGDQSLYRYSWIL